MRPPDLEFCQDFVTNCIVPPNPPTRLTACSSVILLSTRFANGTKFAIKKNNTKRTCSKPCSSDSNSPTAPIDGTRRYFASRFARLA